MKMNALLVGVASAGLFASAATADVDYAFDGLAAAGFNFFQQGGPLQGEITGYSGEFILNSPGENFTYCDDLCILIANEDFTEVVLQIGGYSIISPEYYTWDQGGSSAAGTLGGGSGTLSTAIDATGYYAYIGNGYGGGGIGDWTGSVQLTGSVIPAPGALAMLGLAGLCARRRRA